MFHESDKGNSVYKTQVVTFLVWTEKIIFMMINILTLCRLVLMYKYKSDSITLAETSQEDGRFIHVRIACMLLKLRNSVVSIPLHIFSMVKLPISLKHPKVTDKDSCESLSCFINWFGSNLVLHKSHYIWIHFLCA